MAICWVSPCHTGRASVLLILILGLSFHPNCSYSSGAFSFLSSRLFHDVFDDSVAWTRSLPYTCLLPRLPPACDLQFQLFTLVGCDKTLRQVVRSLADVAPCSNSNTMRLAENVPVLRLQLFPY